MAQTLAVRVESAVKSYGTKIVLSNLCMHVQKGIIYGLLGASGCGKTTLLNCIVGIRNLDSGKLSVLGCNLDVSGPPTSSIGYMPQEVALAAEFTVQEAVCYFGKIYSIPSQTIRERFENLSALLELPEENKLIKKCSGGEQRRVSFAVALINNPKLLILDEPTVGLDPLLRETIWNYLLDLVKENDTAVIITTHYIEEAKQAHKVGFMREGQLLAEDSPDKLLTLHGTDTLEEVFLILSKQQSEGVVTNRHTRNNSDFTSDSIDHTSEATATNPSKKQWHKRKLREINLNWNRLRALFLKNLIQLSRNISGTFFTFLFPVISMLALLIAVGDDVKNLKLGIVNDETSCENNSETFATINVTERGCDIRNLSCRFIRDLDDSMIDRVFFDDTAEALNELNHGKVWGVLHIPSEFSLALEERIEGGYQVSDQVLNLSQIEAWIDVSNKQIGKSLKRKLNEKVLKFQQNVLDDCKYSSRSADSIVRFESVLYGNKDDKFTVFMIPGMLLAIIFFMGVTNTADTIITDRLGGIWHRSAVAGVSSLEIILTHFTTQFFIVLIQALELLILTFFIYKAEYQGSLVEVMVIMIVEGICGMSYGLWISVLCKNHSVANFIATGSFYPLMLVGGVLWPLEGMSKVLQYLAFCLPVALPTISLREVIQKGWNFTYFQVYVGMGVQLVWIVLLGVICVYQLKCNR